MFAPEMTPVQYGPMAMRQGRQTANGGDIQTAHTAKLFSQDPFNSRGYDIAVDWRFCEKPTATLTECAATPAR
jgi:hypothetical protein